MSRSSLLRRRGGSNGARADAAREPASLLDDALGRESVDAVQRGLLAGLVATAIMTAFRLPIMRSLPPTANAAARFGGGEPSDYPVVGLVLHVLYGAVAGCAFGLGFSRLDENRALGPEERGLLWGAVYGLGLSVLGTQVVLPGVANARPDEDEVALFHASHLVYGLALGGWVGSRTRGVPDDADYDYEGGHDRGLRALVGGRE